MRKSFTLLFFFLFFTVVAHSQSGKKTSFSNHAEKLTLRDTIHLPDVPRDELYSRAWRWFSEEAKKTPSLLEEANKRYGRFTGTSSIIFVTKQTGGNEYVKGRIYYNITVYVNDDQYTYEITDFTHVGRISFNTITTNHQYPYRTVANEEWHNLVWQEMKEQIQNELGRLISSLKEGMQKETENFEHYKAISEKSPTNGD